MEVDLEKVRWELHRLLNLTKQRLEKAIANSDPDVSEIEHSIECIESALNLMKDPDADQGWLLIPEKEREEILSNAYCENCERKTSIEPYSISQLKKYWSSIKVSGKCEECGESVSLKLEVFRDYYEKRCVSPQYSWRHIGKREEDDDDDFDYDDDPFPPDLPDICA